EPDDFIYQRGTAASDKKQDQEREKPLRFRDAVLLLGTHTVLLLDTHSGNSKGGTISYSPLAGNPLLGSERQLSMLSGTNAISTEGGKAGLRQRAPMSARKLAAEFRGRRRNSEPQELRLRPRNS